MLADLLHEQNRLNQGRRNDLKGGGALSARSGMNSEFCLSVLATASFSKLLDMGKLKIVLWNLNLQKV